MASAEPNLRECFVDADSLRRKVEGGTVSNIADTQKLLTRSISKYEQCSKLAEELSLFSDNEDLEDISSKDLQYLLIPFYIAQLVFRLVEGDRRSSLLKSRIALEHFLSRINSYGILNKNDIEALERYYEDPDHFSMVAISDASRRREVKISNFKAEKALKNKLEHLQRNPRALEEDEATIRALHLTNIALSVHHAFQSLESIALELQVLAIAPTESLTNNPDGDTDHRSRVGRADGYSERLDPPIATNGRNGPILSGEGRPLRPFTLLDTRQRMQQGVFRPDHSLPTMTIDEYLDEERKRGGMISGGGPQSQQRPRVDEDNMDLADEATMKAREWDEFAEANPKGSGNTMNMG